VNCAELAVMSDRLAAVNANGAQSMLSAGPRKSMITVAADLQVIITFYECTDSPTTGLV
jgi:hypothetical protein